MVRRPRGNVIEKQKEERGCQQTEAQHNAVIETEVKQKALMQLPDRHLFSYCTFMLHLNDCEGTRGLLHYVV